MLTSYVYSWRMQQQRLLLALCSFRHFCLISEFRRTYFTEAGSIFKLLIQGTHTRNKGQAYLKCKQFSRICKIKWRWRLPLAFKKKVVTQWYQINYNNLKQCNLVFGCFATTTCVAFLEFFSLNVVFMIFGRTFGGGFIFNNQAKWVLQNRIDPISQ